MSWDNARSNNARPTGFTGLASFARFQKSPFVRFLIRRRAGTPMALLPDVHIRLLHGVGFLHPFARQPDVARMWPCPPMALHPNPLAAPFPVPGDKIPQRPRPGRRRNDILLIGRRRLSGLPEVDVIRRRHLRTDFGGRGRSTTREQRQGGSDGEHGGQNRNFHVRFQFREFSGMCAVGAEFATDKTKQPLAEFAPMAWKTFGQIKRLSANGRLPRRNPAREVASDRPSRRRADADAVPIGRRPRPNDPASPSSPGSKPKVPTTRAGWAWLVLAAAAGFPVALQRLRCLATPVVRRSRSPRAAAERRRPAGP